jgi:hypothetical protein
MNSDLGGLGAGPLKVLRTQLTVNSTLREPLTTILSRPMLATATVAMSQIGVTLDAQSFRIGHHPEVLGDFDRRVLQRYVDPGLISAMKNSCEDGRGRP